MITTTDEKIIHEYVYGNLSDEEQASIELRMVHEKPLRLYCQQLRQRQLDDARQNWNRMQKAWPTRYS